MGGLLVFLGLIVVPFILWSIFGPKSQWQVLSSWKYRNPDANEPSDAAYAMTRIGGVVGLIALVVVGINLVRSDREYRELTAPKTTEPFVIPEAKDLGPVAVVDYYVEESQGKPLLYVGFLFSGDRVSPGSCTLVIDSRGEGTARVSVKAHARWAPQTREGSYGEYFCTPNSSAYPTSRELGETVPGVVVVTDGPVYNPETKVTTPAAPGNLVPLRKTKTSTSAPVTPTQPR